MADKEILEVLAEKFGQLMAESKRNLELQAEVMARAATEVGDDNALIRDWSRRFSVSQKRLRRLLQAGRMESRVASVRLATLMLHSKAADLAWSLPFYDLRKLLNQGWPTLEKANAKPKVKTLAELCDAPEDEVLRVIDDKRFVLRTVDQQRNLFAGPETMRAYPSKLVKFWTTKQGHAELSVNRMPVANLYELAAALRKLRLKTTADKEISRKIEETLAEQWPNARSHGPSRT